MSAVAKEYAAESVELPPLGTTVPSGIEVPVVVTRDMCRNPDPGQPGEGSFTRGIFPDGYRGRLWTVRQYSGFGTAADTNGRFKYLLEHGQTGLSTAFDMPTLMGYDPDSPRALGEVGREGVSIASLDDMARLFDGIPLGDVTTSMTINAPAIYLLAAYVAVGERQGVAPARLPGESRGEREIIEAALAASRGRVAGRSGAAARLGVPPSTLTHRIKALRINKTQFKFR